MFLKTGQVVFSLKGRDKGKFLAVVGYDGSNPLVCDGGERPLERPKKKNERHLQKTNLIIDPESMATNKKLRKALKNLIDQGR